MEENKELSALLERIEKNSARQARYARWQCFFSLVAVVLCVMAVVCVMDLLPRIETIAQQVDVVMQDIQLVTSQLAQADWENLVSDLEQVSSQMASADLSSIVEEVNGLVRSSQTGLEQTMDKLNSIDFDTLNKAISDLSKVVEPLAKLFGR